jgi:hypothetical protein
MALLLDSRESTLFFKPPLLITESQEDFASLSAALVEEIKPLSVVERIYVADFAAIVWEILRLRRYKTDIINNARLAALRGILKQLLCCPRDADAAEITYFYAYAVKDLARGFFVNETTQKRVANLLRSFQMDEGAIDAEAFRICAEDLERLERMLTALEFRRDKALRSIADYRQILSKQLRVAGDRILDEDLVPRLVPV